MPDPKRLDLARWTPAGFVLDYGFGDKLFSAASLDEIRRMVPIRAGEGLPFRVLGLPGTGAGDFVWPTDAARLVILRGGAETVTLVTLHRADFLAPQWLRSVPLPPPSFEAVLARVPILVAEEWLSDTLTLDATAPGWQEGDVVAVVGTDREGE